MNQGLGPIRKMGTFVEFSVFKDLVTADWSIISDRKELNLLGSHLTPYCYETVIEWIEAGKLPTRNVATHVFPLDRWEEAFRIAEKDDRSIKVMPAP